MIDAIVNFLILLTNKLTYRENYLGSQDWSLQFMTTYLAHHFGARQHIMAWSV